MITFISLFLSSFFCTFFFTLLGLFPLTLLYFYFFFLFSPFLMLADGCEAALRSLPPDTSEAEAKDTVRRIVESRQVDGQLRKSGLSRSEVELVVQAFVKVWRRMRHRRIPYPIPARPRHSA